MYRRLSMALVMGALTLAPFTGTAHAEARHGTPVECAELKTMAPTVDSLPTAAWYYIDPATGDLYIGGTTQDDLVIDCPPFVA